MINILIPLAGKSTFKTNKTNLFPKILSDINGKLLIEHAAEPFTSIKLEKKIIVAIPKKETEKYKLNKVIALLGDDIHICEINGNTQGAVCSALLAIEKLNLDTPLIISSFEQVFDLDLSPHISTFIEQKVDAGVLTFNAIHPKWSYVKSDENGNVTQAAEKMPISKQAIAGLFYYKTARTFIEAAKEMIRKDIKINNNFFISPTLNEIILIGGYVKSIEIDKTKYFHINDEHSLESFETKSSDDKKNNKKILEKKNLEYISAFNDKNLDKIASFFADEFKLVDPNLSISGKNSAIAYIKDIFNKVNNLSFIAENIFYTDDFHSIIEFRLIIDEKVFFGTDIIQWNKEFNMLKMNAYIYEKKHG